MRTRSLTKTILKTLPVGISPQRRKAATTMIRLYAKLLIESNLNFHKAMREWLLVYSFGKNKKSDMYSYTKDVYVPLCDAITYLGLPNFTSKILGNHLYYAQHPIFKEDTC